MMNQAADQGSGVLVAVLKGGCLKIVEKDLDETTPVFWNRAWYLARFKGDGAGSVDGASRMYAYSRDGRVQYYNNNNNHGK